jgi:hypothetical protein
LKKRRIKRDVLRRGERLDCGVDEEEKAVRSLLCSKKMHEKQKRRNKETFFADFRR